MAKLINGDGNPAIYAAEDSDWFASIMGNQTSITGVGSQFAATITDANTVTVADGVIITKEGRRIQLDVNTDDSFTIPAGQQDVTNYYIIGYHLVSNDLSVQTAEKFVQLMDSASATIPEDTFRGGADDVYVSLYRVTQVGLTLTSLQALLPKITNVHGTEAMLSTVQNSNKASRTFNKGEYIQLNNTYYEITATVASGATFTEGVNISATDIGAELTQINSDLTKNYSITNISVIAINNQYTALSDGYISIMISQQSLNSYGYILIKHNGGNYFAGSYEYAPNGLTASSVGFFLKKGMTVTIGGSNAQAYFLAIN